MKLRVDTYLLPLEKRNVDIDPLRALVIVAFATLPDEAFGFFAGTMLNMSREAGGFQSDSRAAIEALGKLVERYYELKSEKPQIHEKK